MNFATPTSDTQICKARLARRKFNVTAVKLLADAHGDLSVSNVGKSTFISRYSAAKPGANYHFTTITPCLEVVTVGEKVIRNG